MKSLLLTLLLFLAAVPAASAFDACAPDAKTTYAPLEERYRKGVLFRIERCKSPTSYLLGTMHTDDPAVIARAAPAFNALDKMKVAVFEIISTPETQRTVAQFMFLPPESKGLVELAGQVRFGRLVSLLRESEPQFQPAILNRYRPWAASVLMSLPKMRADGIVLDEKLQARAKERGIALEGLETLSQQFQAFTQMSLSQQLAMLDDSLNRHGDIAAMNTQLFSHYRMRDLKKIHALGERSFEDMPDEDLRDALKQAILTDRNAHMAEAMQPYLEKGEAFVAIGALHLWGDDGVLKRLESEGYFLFPDDSREQ